MKKKTFQAKNHIKISNFAESNMHRKTNARASFMTDFYFFSLIAWKMCRWKSHWKITATLKIIIAKENATLKQLCSIGFSL